MRALTFVTTFALTLITCCACTAATVLPERIETNRTWTKANSPYELRSNVFIGAGARVIVESGVTVIARGDWRLTIAGTLTAQADAHDRIIFRATDQEAVGALHVRRDGLLPALPLPVGGRQYPRGLDGPATLRLPGAAGLA